ncbi:hypothetical protein KKG66_04365 [bacterium]|nr:hypothetical protein [bacterium]MBU1920057.1 hypothetical protein [bacterium]
MKNFSWASAVFLLSLLLVVSIGCDNTKSGTGGTTDNSGVGLVTLSILTDTLRFLPGDSASTTITVIVSDQQGNVMEGQRVALSLSNPQLGFIEFLDTELRDTTNAQGRVDLLFTAIGTPGDNDFTATVGNVTATRHLAIREQSVLVGSLTLTVTPKRLQAAVGQEAVSDVKVVVADNQGVAIPNLSVPVSCTMGRLAPLPATNDSGIARTKWFSNDQFGEAIITARAGTLEHLIKHDTVFVEQLPYLNGTLTVDTDVLTIRADGCVTKANITATLKDAFGAAMVNDTIRFGAPGLIGSIEPYALTDSVGKATLTFCEQNIPNEEGSDSAMVVARYAPWGLADTVRIWVYEAEPVGHVEISVGSVIGTAGIDSVEILLDARYASGAPVMGHYAHFTSFPCGEFTADSMRVVGGNLETPVMYIMCKTIPAGVDVPWIEASIQGVLSNRIILDPQPGRASRIVLEAPLTAEVNTPITITAVVQDTFNNYVEDGQLVLFESDLGSIGSISQTVGGFANTNFNPGTQAGQAQIKAIAGVAVDSTVISIGSDLPNSIYLTVSEPSLEAAGTGGIEWTQLQATVLDANGNEVEDGTWVRFEILASPGGGININDHGNLDSTQTANGTAVATLNSGQTPGPVLIRACVDGVVVWPDSIQIVPICVQHGGITIVAGPPANVFIYPTELAVDGGGAAWDLEVSALVVDEQQNPVRCGVSVFFDVFPPSTAEILSRNVVTCNQDINSDSADGVAYTILRYLSPQTFNTITLKARTANNVRDSIQFELPLQGGILDLNCAPGAWHFVQQGNPCNIQCTATVQDEHDVLINGAYVYYTAQRGLLFPFSSPTSTPNPNLATSYAFTGPPNPSGQAILWLNSPDEFIFPSPDIPEISGEVSAEVVGYSVASDAQNINFRH